VPIPPIHAELALFSERGAKGVIEVLMPICNLDENFVAWENEGTIETVQHLFIVQLNGKAC
jgi:hypothetical protein